MEEVDRATLKERLASAMAAAVGAGLEFEGGDKETVFSIQAMVDDLLDRMERRGVTLAACEPVKKGVEVINSSGQELPELPPGKTMDDVLIQAGLLERDAEGNLQPTPLSRELEGKLAGFDISVDENGEMTVELISEAEAKKALGMQ